MLRQHLEKQCDVLVSGMGPAGLAVAYEAAKQGKRVVILEKRDGQFSRSQRVYIGMAERKYLVEMRLGKDNDHGKFPDACAYECLRVLSKLERKAFFAELRKIAQLGESQKLAAVNQLKKELATYKSDDATMLSLIDMLDEKYDQLQTIISNYQDAKLINEALNPFNPQAAAAQIPIRHIERYLLNRIEDLNINAGCNIVDVMTHSSMVDLDDNGCKLMARVETTSKDNAPVVSLISFKYLIGADGVWHPSADIVNNKLPWYDKIQYERIRKEAFKKSDHLFIHFKLQSGNCDLKLAKDFCILSASPPAEPAASCINFVSFDLHSYESSGKQSIKCVVISEMADSLKPSSDSQFPMTNIMAYVKRCVLLSNAIPGLSEDDMEIEILAHPRKNNRPQMLMFSNGDAMKANKMYVHLNDRQHYILVGDANFHPDYQHSHGTRDALNQAQSLAKVFAGVSSLEEYVLNYEFGQRAMAGYYRMRREGTSEFVRLLTKDTNTFLYGMRKQ